MSDSTPEKTPNERATEPDERPVVGRPDPTLGAWWIVSLCLHVGALAAIIYFSPLRTILYEPREALDYEVTAEPDVIEEAIEKIRQQQEENVREKVQELLDIEQDMEHLLQEKLAQFEQFAAEFSEDAPSEALEAQTQALEFQQEALEAQQQAAEAQEGADAAQSEAAAAPAGEVPAAQDKAVAAQTNAQKAQTVARDAQIKAGNAQREAAEMLAMSGALVEDATKAQAKAIEAQEDADQAEIEAQAAQDAAKKAQADAQKARGKALSTAEKARQAQTEADELRAEAIKTQRAADAARSAADTASAAASEAGEKANQAKREARKEKTPEAEAAAEQAAEAAAKARDQANQTNRTARALGNQARGLRNRAAKAKDKADSLQASAISAEKGAQDAQGQAAAAQRAAKEVQDAATKAQKAARDAQARAREALHKAMQGPPAEGDVAAESPLSHPQTTQPHLIGQDLAGLYETATETEGRIAEAYQGIRASDLAMIRKVPLDQALASTEVARPSRPSLNQTLLSVPVRSAAAAARHNEEVRKALREIDSMVSLGRRLSMMARGEGEGETEGLTLSMDWVRQMSELDQQMQALALEDAQARAKDLTALMKGVPGMTQAEGEGQAEAQAATHIGPPGFGPKRPGEGDKEGRGTGYSAFPSPVPKKGITAHPGRKVIAGGADEPWMYVDSWYTIGPFPNPERRYIDTKFPPETVIDLDNAYAGKDGRTVRWEFLQSPRVTIVPYHKESYAIYYAYTELYFDEPRDLWVALGSDDKSKFWVNDFLIWASGAHHKPWRPDEGFRKVHFRKGLNRVLVRLENGHGSTTFSMLICTQPNQ